jgi:hypothetical protein
MKRKTEKGQQGPNIKVCTSAYLFLLSSIDLSSDWLLSNAHELRTNQQAERSLCYKVQTANLLKVEKHGRGREKI